MEDVYCSTKDNKIVVIGGTIEHVIKAGLEEDEFSLDDLDRDLVSVWKFVGRAKLMAITQRVGDPDEEPEG